MVDVEKIYDVVAFGEILIDFTPCGKSDAGQQLFEQNPGGAPANVLAALSKFGRKTAFIGKVGADMHGAFLRDVLKAGNISIEGLVEGADAFTTLAFVALSDVGERSFSFARKPGADTCLRKEEVKEELISRSRVFHIGSLSLTTEPVRGTTFYALEAAKKADCIVSYDPNYRAPLWESRADAIYRMRSVLPYVDVMKISEEETELLTDITNPEEAAKKLIEQGVALVAVTLGDKGALVCNHEGTKYVPGYKAQMVDTTGAGDSFWGGFLHKLMESGKKPQEIWLEEVADFAKFGNAVASLCVEKRGAIPAMPTIEEVRKRL